MLIIAGCCSLPERLANDAYNDGDNCVEIAEKLIVDLKIHGYKHVVYCQDSRHAWVELVTDRRYILDASMLYGKILLVHPHPGYIPILTVQRTP